ncbi:MAG: hypothetical protein WCK47_13525 [bacterium]|nr:hypothetical protein [Candidatus Sumerlaeota bacterium]
MSRTDRPGRSAAPSHYLMREPGLALPLLALTVNIVLIAFLMSSLRMSRERVRVVFEPARQTEKTAPVAALIPALQVAGENDLRLDGERLTSLDDLEFRLEGRSGAGSSMLLRLAPGVPASLLTRILKICAEAGFSFVALENAEKP